MILYLLVAAVVLFIWYIKDFFGSDVLHNYSDNEVPLIRTSFNVALKTPVDIFKFPRECALKFGRSYRHQFFWNTNFEICRARDAEKILGSSKHTDKSIIYSLLDPFLKTGLLTSKGEKWHTRRRMLTPAFHFEILKEFFDVFREEGEKLVESLSLKVEKPVDIIPISTQFTLNTICESAMGVKLQELGDNGVNYRRNIYVIGKLLLHRMLRPWLLSDFMYSLLGYRREVDIALKPIHEFTKSIIMERKSKFEIEDKQQKAPLIEDPENVYFRSKKRRFAMMDTLLKAQREGLIDDEGIIEETDTFTFEGHDTTSSAMTFSLLLLAHHPEAQEKIFEEMEDFLEGKEELSMDDYNRLEYLDRVVKESLRIYPSVPFISRELSEDLFQDGIKYLKGSLVNIHIYDVHHDPEAYPDPEKFDPDRFLPENSINRHNYAFIAFSAGMRNCIGQKFAMLELKVMLTKVVKNFKLLPITRRDEITFIADMVLRSKYPIKMMFKHRN